MVTNNSGPLMSTHSSNWVFICLAFSFIAFMTGYIQLLCLKPAV